MSEDQITEEEGTLEGDGANDSVAETVPDDDQSEAQVQPSLEEQLALAEAQAQEYLDGWQRARAELANYKKRHERERTDMHVRARVAVIARFLDVADDFGRALENAPDSPDMHDWLEGFSLIDRKLGSILEAEGVTEIEAEGQEFDPAWHEAISQQPSEDHSEGQIVTVVQKGYRLGDQVVRPARVIIAG